MKKHSIILIFLVLIFGIINSPAQVFNPAEDGWFFVNWGETSDLSWDLFRKAYLGVNPTNNCVQAPLDCAFFEIFKGIANGGNCGGMSLLALSMFKHGGYMGFCSTANFYTGIIGPDRTDLHQAINILQARQFSAAGVSNFIDIMDAGNIDDAENAFKDVKESLAKGDYPVLSIATDMIGDSAHTVIPYRIEESGGTKTMYIWDPNHPYDDDPSHYNATSTANRMVITSPTNWSYTSGSTTYSGSSSWAAWCFCIPMSIIRPKSRHPMAVDMVNEALMSLFVGSPASSVSQITDRDGNRFYKTDVDEHTSRNEIENDPNKRIKGMVRWPWFGYVQKGPDGKNQVPGELYFIRSSARRPRDLNITLSGKKYEAVISFSGNIIQINSESKSRVKDVIRLSNFATSAQTIDIQTLGDKRDFTIRQLRTDATGKKWRRFHVTNLKVSRDSPVKIQMLGDLEAIQVNSREKKVTFDLEIQQQIEGVILTRSIKHLSTTPGKLLRVAPKNWRALEKTELKQEMIQPIQRLQRDQMMK